MSDDVNSVRLVGDLARDPEVRGYGPAEGVLAMLRVVTTFGRNKEEHHSVTAFNDVARICEGMRKGDRIEVRGYIHTRSWDDKDTGKKRYATEVVANEVLAPGGPLTNEREPGEDDDGPF